jgi:molybdate transport repressor ModE-like protein
VPRLPELDSLRLLVEVAERGSIGAAARARGISQQAASERLRSTEGEIGLSLLTRSPSGSRLTTQGRLVVEWSTALLAHADQMEASLRTLRSDRSRELHVHASMTTAEHLVPRWLVQLRLERSVNASLVASNTAAVIASVRSGDADLGFIEGPGDLTGLAHQDAGGDSLRLVASPDDPWVHRSSALSLVTISRRPLTSREQGSGTRRVAEDAFRRAGYPLAAPEVELTTNAAVLAAVRAGGAPALLSDLTLRPVDDLVVLDVPGLNLTRTFTAIWSGGQRPPAGPIRDLLAISRRSHPQSRQITTSI